MQPDAIRAIAQQAMAAPALQQAFKTRHLNLWGGVDQALFDLYEAGLISYEDALRNADSKNELRLRIKLESKREVKNIDDGGALRIVDEEQGRVI